MPNFKDQIAKFCINYRVAVVSMLVILTGFFAYSASRVSFKTVFQDLLPSDHPYVKINEKYTEQFGGPNMVSIRIHAKKGDIFRPEVLEVIKTLQNDLRYVTAVNQFQIISLASKKLKRTVATTELIESLPLMWPHVPKSKDELEKLKQAVIENPLAYGSYVSRDLKSALVTIDFIDRLVDYDKIYADLNNIIDGIDTSNVTVSVVGDPMLRGIVNSYLPETILIFAGSLLAMCMILFFLFMRTWRGTLIPLINAIISGIWALGIGHIFGLNMDPLGIVITFLITARVISHSVQSVTRFEEIVGGHKLINDNMDAKETSKVAAEVTLGSLFRPGILSVITDAGGILVVALAPIPLLQKTALLGCIWVSCIVVTGVIMTPVLLSWVKHPTRVVFPLNVDRFYNFVLRRIGKFVTGRYKVSVMIVILIIFTVGLYYASRITVGDAESGDPLLWPDSEYNQASKLINEDFLGTNRLLVVLEGEGPDALKEPRNLDNILQFQKHMELLPKVGGSVSIADLIPNVSRILFEGNPRYEQIGDKAMNGEFLYTYLTSSEPGDLERFSDQSYQNGAVTMYLQDHRGETIRKAIAWVNRFISNSSIDGIDYKLAGGLIGLLAAVNEVIFAGQVESIAFALLVVLITCGLTYSSTVSGIFFIVPILISNILTFNYMTYNNIGLNINTLPVAALGIGLGVDYAIYVVDSIKGYFEYSKDIRESVFYGLRTAGRGVINTAVPLILCTTIWFFFSSLRFQAEMAILIAIWMGISALSALIVMPSMIYIFRPRFVFGDIKK